MPVNPARVGEPLPEFGPEPPAELATNAEPPTSDPSALASAVESNELAEDVRGLFPGEVPSQASQSNLARYVLAGILVLGVLGLSAAAAARHWQDIQTLANRLTSKTPPPQSASTTSPNTAAASETGMPRVAIPPVAESNSSQVNASVARVPPVEQPTKAPPAPSGASRQSKARIRPASNITRTLDPRETEGEKYLNGDGVAVDCDRAQKDLLAAARHSPHSSARADRALAEMYATGHCVIRDLPLAYRWFARAQRQNRRPDPQLASDMKRLWDQMSPEERTLAAR